MAKDGSVLYADNDPNWVELLQTAFEGAWMPNEVQGAKDGPEAISYLSKEGPYADRAADPLPELVLLELRLPGMNGFEVLQWIRRQRRLAGLAVVMMTGVAGPGDAERAQEQGATAFLTKPFSFTGLVEMARQIRDQWLPSVPLAEKC